MSGDHNQFCSGNQPSLVQRLREEAEAGWHSQLADFFAEAADEIERLEKELKETRNQLAVVKKIRDNFRKSYKETRLKLEKIESQYDMLVGVD